MWAFPCQPPKGGEGGHLTLTRQSSAAARAGGNPLPHPRNGPPSTCVYSGSPREPATTGRAPPRACPQARRQTSQTAGPVMRALSNPAVRGRRMQRSACLRPNRPRVGPFAARVVVVCRVGRGAGPPSRPLPRGLDVFAARVALCRAGGGALQVEWWCFAAQVQLCRVSDRILTCLGPMGAPQEAKLNPRGKGPLLARQSATRAAKTSNPRGKAAPARQRTCTPRGGTRLPRPSPGDRVPCARGSSTRWRWRAGR